MRTEDYNLGLQLICRCEIYRDEFLRGIAQRYDRDHITRTKHNRDSIGYLAALNNRTGCKNHFVSCGSLMNLHATRSARRQNAPLVNTSPSCASRKLRAVVVENIFGCGGTERGTRSCENDRVVGHRQYSDTSASSGMVHVIFPNLT